MPENIIKLIGTIDNIKHDIKLCEAKRAFEEMHDLEQELQKFKDNLVDAVREEYVTSEARNEKEAR